MLPANYRQKYHSAKQGNKRAHYFFTSLFSTKINIDSMEKKVQNEPHKKKNHIKTSDWYRNTDGI